MTQDTAPATADADVPGLYFHHEDDGGDGRLHVATDTDACPCGAKHVGSTKKIPIDDPSAGLGFNAPEMYCDRARELVAGPKPAEPPPPPQTQAVATQPQQKKEAVPFHPRDTGEMMRYANFLAGSDLIPYSLRKKPNDILVVLLKGQDLGLTPMQSIAGINVINGRAEVGALLMVSMIRKSGLCEKWQLIESTDKRAVYKTKRRGDDDYTIFEYTIEEAEAAGLPRKGKNPAESPWNTQRRTMLRRRCQSMLAREVYPDIVAGLYDHGELSEMRELEMDLIRTGMEATRAGFAVVDVDTSTTGTKVAADVAEAEPGWMTKNGDRVSVAPDVVEVLPAPAPQPAPAPPVDPLKARMKARAAAAKTAQPSLLEPDKD